MTLDVPRDAPAPTDVGSLVRHWRQRRRLSQQALSDQCGVSTRHLSYIETGRARPSAIFASNDDMALAVLRIAAELGLKSPDDISVGGFDNTPSAQLSSPPLTSIRQPVGEMAVEATDMLLQMIRGEPLASTARVLPFTLVHGGSTGPASAAASTKPAWFRR